jgi:hypothetical protein
MAVGLSLILAPSLPMAGRNISGRSFSFNRIFHASLDYYPQVGFVVTFARVKGAGISDCVRACD